MSTCHIQILPINSQGLRLSSVFVIDPINIQIFTAGIHMKGKTFGGHFVFIAIESAFSNDHEMVSFV